MKAIDTTSFTFESFVKKDLLYVDKSMYAYELLTSEEDSVFRFLARPRRWGKTLFLSMIESALEGRKDLFTNLYLGSSDYDFHPCPVLHFDMSMFSVVCGIKMFTYGFSSYISMVFRKYGISLDTDMTPGELLATGIRELYEKAGERVAVLIDEYDTPLVDALSVMEGAEIRAVIRDFYAKLKPCAGFIKFLFITGITRFPNQSIFSKLNNLVDITFDPGYSTAFGYTQKELESYFAEGIDERVLADDIGKDELLERLKYWYDGYSFCSNGEHVYNPVSVNSFFGRHGRGFSGYWADTASSTMVVNLVRRCPFVFTPGELKEVRQSVLNNFMIEDFSPDAPLDEEKVYGYLYMSGYLTIDHIDGRFIYLKIPNHEVEEIICDVLADLYAGKRESSIGRGIREAIRTDDVDALGSEIRNLILIPPYDAQIPLERYYQSLIYVVMKGIDQIDVRCEEHTASGRADLIVFLGSKLVVIELKINSSAEKAMEQILSRRYWESHDHAAYSVMLLGINIDTKDGVSVSWTGRTLT